jgi:pyridoxine kinase
MARQVLSISSQVAFGPVGNTAAVPALHAAGFTVLQVPTIILSNHPGHGKPAGMRVPAAEIAAILAKLEELESLQDCMGVMTGYFADAAQVSVVASHIRHMKQSNPDLFVLVDPVLGDADALYVPVDVAAAIRDELVPLATGVTPNRFELSWLSGQNVSNRTQAIAAASTLACEEVLATSIPVDGETIATLAIWGTESAEVITRLKPSVPNGTGDFLAGLYLACRLNGYAPAQALNLSSALVEQAIVRSVGQSWLDVVGALHDH